MSKSNLQTVVYQEGKYYVAQCLNVDISSFGENEKAALTNLQEALELYFEDSSPSEVSLVSHPSIHTLSV